MSGVNFCRGDAGVWVIELRIRRTGGKVCGIGAWGCAIGASEARTDAGVESTGSSSAVIDRNDPPIGSSILGFDDKVEGPGAGVLRFGTGVGRSGVGADGRDDNVRGAATNECVARDNDSGCRSNVFDAGTKAGGRGSSGRASGNNFCETSANETWRHTNTRVLHRNICRTRNNGAAAGTHIHINRTNDFGTGRGSSESSSNTAKRDANISDIDTNERKRHDSRRDGRVRRTRRQSRVQHTFIEGNVMNRLQTQILQWARRLRDFLLEHDLKSEIAELPALRQELDDSIAQLTADAADQDAITKQARVQTTEIKRLRTELRDGHIKPIVRMSRTMQLEINGSTITFVLPNFNIDNERLAQAADGMVKALNVVGPQFVAKGFAANFVEQLTNATKALREAVDERAAQVARRTGATAAMKGQENRTVQLVGVIDTLVRPVIKNDPELMAAWENLAALPRTPRVGGVVVTPLAGSAQPVTPSA